MEYAVGTILRIEGQTYVVIGKIKYKNRNDGLQWFEYRLRNKANGKEMWLSSDEYYREYSISEVVRNADTSGYHVVDRGTEEVVGAWGQVDVEYGDRASFVEYEDNTEELIISHETWDDGLEVSTGHYVDAENIVMAGTEKVSSISHSAKKSSSISASAIVMIASFCMVIFGMVGGSCDLFNSTPKISDYLKKSSSYTYTTSITGEDGEKADVYKTSMTVDATVKDIIKGIDGNTESVQQNTEDGDDSVAILTKKEYCLVYTSEDDETLVQVSSRKYAYSSDNEPYRSGYGTSRYYRRFYRSRAYTSDSTTYGDVTSPYSTYNDTTLSSNSTDTYSSYASSVRQSSAKARSSSGGGTSSGK